MASAQWPYQADAPSTNTPASMGHVTADTELDKRPKEVDDRKIAGHWEGDLIIELKRSAVATLIERTTRYAMLVHLSRQVGYGIIAPKKNGLALAGYGALTMKDVLVNAMSSVPASLRRSLTWDRGKELSAHALFTEETKILVYFADAKNPWQRGSNGHRLNTANFVPRSSSAPSLTTCFSGRWAGSVLPGTTR